MLGVAGARCSKVSCSHNCCFAARTHFFIVAELHTSAGRQFAQVPCRQAQCVWVALNAMHCNFAVRTVMAALLSCSAGAGGATAAKLAALVLEHPLAGELSWHAAAVGDDDDYFNFDDEGGDGDGDRFFRTVIKQLYTPEAINAVLQEWFRTLATLPAIIRQSVELGLFSSAQLVRFLSMDVRPGMTRAVTRSLPPAVSSLGMPLRVVRGDSI